MTQKPIQKNNGQYTTPPKTSGKVRVDYIDLLKGITILWIIWIHSYHPDFGNFRMPIFFFASGIFFKLSDTSTFFSKRWYSIIIPCLFFYVASIPFRFIVDLWDYRTIYAFDWNRLWDLFSYSSRRDYLSLNPPLWFLLALFFIQSLSFIVFRLDKKLVFFICAIILFFHDELLEVPSFFMINMALAYFGYFGMGYLFGKPLIRIMSNFKRKSIVFSVSLLFLFGCIWYLDNGGPDFHAIVERIKQFSFVISFMAFFSFLDGVRWLNFLRFFGKESLIVLGAHLWILIPIKRMIYKFLPIQDPTLGFFIAVATACILYPLIIYLNKTIPFFIGKRKPIGNRIPSISKT